MEVFTFVLLVAVVVIAAVLFLGRKGPLAPPPDIGVQLGALLERVGAVEANQRALSEGVRTVGSGVSESQAIAAGLRDATEAIRGELSQAREGLAGMQAASQARHELEERSARSLQRLEQVIAGTSAKGAAGENIVDLVFSRLPPEWQARDFRVGNRTVEFGLRLPNGLILPIDSKWPATALVEAFAAADDPAQQVRLRAEIAQAVLEKAREVGKYFAPDLTTSFGVAVVPDAVDELCGAMKADCMRMGVAIVGHGMLVPYLLLVYQTVLRSSHDVDLEKLAGHLEAAERSVQGLQEEVEGRLSRAITMLANSRDDLRGHGARIATTLNAVQVHVPPVEALEAGGPGLLQPPEG
jgi:DNA recombination protein RmuC